MDTVNVTDAKASLSQILQRVLDGEVVAIGRRGIPEVVLRPYRSSDGGPRPLGDYDGPYRMGPDFDDADGLIEEMFALIWAIADLDPLAYCPESHIM